MTTYSLSHLSERTLMRDTAAVASRESGTTAVLLAHLAEVDARQSYRAAAYPSMYLCCLGSLHMSEDSACKRIRAARACREFPALFEAVADRRLHLAAIVMLAPHLTAENVAEFVAAATHRSKAEIEQLIAQRCQRCDVPTGAEAIFPPLTLEAPAPEHAEGSPSAPGRIESFNSPPRVVPIAPDHFELPLRMGQEMRDRLRYAQDLLGHRVAPKDYTEVFDRALKALIRELEKQKFAATSEPRTGRRRPTQSPRHVPADVKEAAWRRDGGRCTFVSDTGRRCASRRALEFDHIDPVVRGGRATADRVRLLCRAHNQLEAERVFGAEFMKQKRRMARRAAEAEQAKVRAKAQEQELGPCLRQLGYRPDEVRQAAAHCATNPDASLEDRVRMALSYLCPRSFRANGEGERRLPPPGIQESPLAYFAGGA